MEKRKGLFMTVALFIVAVIWGSGFAATKIILDSGIEPYAMIGIRFFGAFIIMYSILKVMKIKIEKEEIVVGLIAGILLFSAFAFQTVGLQYTTASKNAFITGTNVVMVPFIYGIVIKKLPKKVVFITSFLCFAGIAVLSLEKDFSFNYGDFLSLICAFLFGVHMVTVGFKIKKNNPMVINCFQMLSAGILGILFNIVFEKSSISTIINFSEVQIGVMSYIIMLNTLICYLIQTMVQKYVNPSKVALILSTEMLFGGFFSILILGDVIDSKLIIGGMMIFISIIISEIKTSEEKI
ncbi:MAG: DMT family transporter [Fusobacteriaceae bacterium]